MFFFRSFSLPIIAFGGPCNNSVTLQVSEGPSRFEISHKTDLLTGLQGILVATDSMSDRDDPSADLRRTDTTTPKLPQPQAPQGHHASPIPTTLPHPPPSNISFSHSHRAEPNHAIPTRLTLLAQVQPMYTSYTKPTSHTPAKFRR